MNPNWAEENLHTIRTLMERSALYRRALAPIMLLAGALGIAAAAIGIFFQVVSIRAFEALWLSTAVLAVVGAFLIARRQAIKDKEAFWSPPTRRVTQALLPPLLAGLCFGLVFMFMFAGETHDESLDLIPVFFWILLYGCALHAAGFFMPRAIKYIGWVFLAGDPIVLFAICMWPEAFQASAHWVMGFFFGVLHLACGVYLYLTEKRKNAA